MRLQQTIDRRFRRRGFTFVEIIACLAIMGVLVSMVTAGRAVHASVAAEAAILKAHVRFAQSMALANNTSEWSVNVGEHSYALQRDGALAPVSFPGEDQAVHSLPDDVRITGGTGLIVLNMWGAPAESHLLTLSDGVSARNVQITGFTGLVP